MLGMTGQQLMARDLRLAAAANAILAKVRPAGQGEWSRRVSWRFRRRCRVVKTDFVMECLNPSCSFDFK